MGDPVTVPLWLFVPIAGFALWSLLDRLLIPSGRWFLRRRLNRLIDTVNRRLDVEIRPFQLTKRQVLIDRLIYDPQVVAAANDYARENKIPREVAMNEVHRYAREIVPTFNAYVYFRVGYSIARTVARFLYRVRLGFADERTLAGVAPDTTVVFVMNHRSNMDYVLVAFLAAERTALSYAVGEWARIWPLQQLIRSMGAYFVRRNSNSPIYRRVLERYVHMATEAGVDPLLQAFCGWSSITGAEGSSGEMFRHFAHLDLTTSSMIVEAVLAALLARKRTGTGQHIEIEMLAAALSLQSSRLAEFFADTNATPPQALGSACTSTVPQQTFRCLDGRWLAVGVESDEQWLRLCSGIGLAILAADERYRTNRGRIEHRAELLPQLETRFASKPLSWWAMCLLKARVPHARLTDFDELRQHPQVVANGFITDLDTPHFGRIAVEGPPWRFSATPSVAVVAGGLAGEHTAQVLAEFNVG